MAEEYVTIYKNDGYPLAEIEPSYLSRSWELNGIGRGEMELPLTDAKLTPEYIRYGNLISVFSDSAPLWAGVILPPTYITPASVRFSLYSGEALLRKRAISGVSSSRGTAGATFRKIISAVHREYQSNVAIGDITETERKLDVIEYWRDAWDLVGLLIEKSQEDFVFEPVVKASRLWFYAHWFAKRGADKSKKIRLAEGHNISADFEIQEMGEFIDDVIVLGKGDDPEERPTVRRTLGSHVGLFGRWCDIVEAPEVDDMDELLNVGRKYLKEHSFPTFRTLIQVQDVDNIWQRFDVGDVVELELVSYDYSPAYVLPLRSRVRILARAYDISDGVMPIVVESFLGDTFEEGVGK